MSKGEATGQETAVKRSGHQDAAPIETEVERVLADWIAERAPLQPPPGAGHAEDDPLIALLSKARSASLQLADDDGASGIGGLRARLRSAAESRRRRRWQIFVASAAMLLAALTWLPRRQREPQASGAPAVVQRMFFEAEHEGRHVRLEMTLYRTDREEERHGAKPPL